MTYRTKLPLPGVPVGTLCYLDESFRDPEGGRVYQFEGRFASFVIKDSEKDKWLEPIEEKPQHPFGCEVGTGEPKTLKPSERILDILCKRAGNDLVSKPDDWANAIVQYLDEQEGRK
jgi:hypothetical protein